MTLYLWALFAGMCAVIAEYIFRTYSHLGFIRLELIVLPLQVGVGLGVYKIFSSTDCFLTGAVIFPFGTAVMRMLVQTFILHETPNAKVYAAFGCILLAQFVRLIPWKE